MKFFSFIPVACLLFVSANALIVNTAVADLQAGAAVVDITPRHMPVIVNGGFIERQTDRINDKLNARCLVLFDGKTKIAIVIVDSCMLPRDVCDRIKKLAAADTGIETNRILISATHTHSAPSAMDYTLGSRADEIYTNALIPKVANCIVLAASRLEAAEIAWGSTRAPAHTFCRRWIRRPDRIDQDPFGEKSVRAMMHPGYRNLDYLGPAGPVDDELSILSVRSAGGRPIGLLANFSMHYVGGVQGISADYFGPFAAMVKEKIDVDLASGDESSNKTGNFVAMMSQGTSGDLHWMDYSRPRQNTSIEKYARELSDMTFKMYLGLKHRTDVDLAMAQATLKLNRRMPSQSRLEWANKLNTARGDRLPGNRPEVYASQAEWIRNHPQEEIVLQTIRIGELGITAIPNEVFGVTGLKLKAQSPLPATFNISLANGAAGYIPPPEQHPLGGYTTWPARTAGLEVDAEPKIVDNLLDLLEQVSGKPRRRLASDLFYPASIRTNMRRHHPTEK